ncbi:MAG TPA: hypothetical protein VF486_13165 [Actinomycetes bacterium]
MALSAPEQVTMLDSATKVPGRHEAEIDAVVLDLPADSRRDAYEELRQRYEGRVVVPVDDARDTSGWPPDAKRRFLVRPFQVADLIAGVQEPQETSVAERAATYRRRFRWNRHQGPPAFPLATMPPTADRPTAPPPRAAEAAPEPVAEEPVAEEPIPAEPTADQAAAVAPEPVPEEADGTGEAEVATEVDDEPATVEFAMEEEAEAGVTAEEAEPATADGEAADGGEATDDEAAAAAAEQDATGVEEDAEAAPEVDEALVAELEELVLAETGEGTEAAAGQPTPLEDLPAEEEPSVPPLPVQAGVAMAEAVALQQWLEAEETKRARQRRRLILANIVAGLVLLLVGVVIGRAISPEPAQPASTPATPRQPATVRTAPPPAACTAAMDNADQVISYLVAKIRDERLSKSIQEYGANARACRTTGR